MIDCGALKNGKYCLICPNDNNDYRLGNINAEINKKNNNKNV